MSTIIEAKLWDAIEAASQKFGGVLAGQVAVKVAWWHAATASPAAVPQDPITGVPEDMVPACVWGMGFYSGALDVHWNVAPREVSGLTREYFGRPITLRESAAEPMALPHPSRFDDAIRRVRNRLYPDGHLAWRVTTPRVPWSEVAKEMDLIRGPDGFETEPDVTAAITRLIEESALCHA